MPASAGRLSHVRRCRSVRISRVDVPPPRTGLYPRPRHAAPCSGPTPPAALRHLCAAPDAAVSEIKANSVMNPTARRQPDTTKTTTSGGNSRLKYGASAMQGYRDTMEDAHVAFEDLDVNTNTSFFGVYDGHGGGAVAKYCAKHLHNEVLRHSEFSSNLPNALRNAFFSLDVLLRDKKSSKELTDYKSGYEYFRTVERSSWLTCGPCQQKSVYDGPLDEGSTACVVLIRNNQIIVGNAGDTRCVLSRNGQATALSTDHKPNVPAETRRIEAAGGSISACRGAFRINEGIAVSRSIGDLRYKQNNNFGPELQALTCSPEIRFEQITDDTEFLVIACDGVWDVMSNQAVVDFVNRSIRHGGLELPIICQNLLDEAITSRPASMDNMTVILVQFEHAGRNEEITESSNRRRRSSSEL
ncbi:hypothetical protein ABZP36_003034 [Zizania latifolia]